MFSTRNKKGLSRFITIKNLFSATLLGIGLYVINIYVDHTTQQAQVALQEHKAQIAQLQSQKAKSDQRAEKLAALVISESNKHKRMERLLKDLDRCKDPAIALSIGFSESRCKYNVIHPTSDLKGIGGIKPGDWGHYLARKKIPVNSLQAIDAVYTLMLQESKHNKTLALKYYKGTINNDYSYRITSAYLHKIKNSKDFYAVLEAHRNKMKLIKELGLEA